MPQHDHRHIQLLEELSLNAWPALQTVVYDGWLLRFAGGMSRRANSVQVLYPSSRPLDEKIDFCETHYERAGLPTAFKLTEAAPAGLDERLAQRGYRREGEISVQTLSLKGRSFEPSELATVLEQPESARIDEFCRLNHERAAFAGILARTLELIAVQAAFVALARNGRVEAVGIAVVEREYVGLFGLAVDERVRRQGLGTALVETCLSFGQLQGAQYAYLQVMASNVPALSLYQRFGFKETYRYWYRLKG